MNTIKKLRDVFSWLDEKPEHQYTLTDLAVKLSDGAVGLGPMQELTRGGRLAERIVTLSGSSLSIAFAVAASAASPFPPIISLPLVALCGMASSKVVAIPLSILAEIAVRFGVGATRLLDKKYNKAEF